MSAIVAAMALLDASAAFVCLLGISTLLLSIPLRPAPDGIHLASIVVASMALYLFVPNRLPWMLIWNAYLVTGFTVIVPRWDPLPGGLMATSLLLLAFVNLLGILTVTRLNRLQREQFASLLEERDTNRKLQTEIEERSQLEERLRYMACTDALTGIAKGAPYAFFVLLGFLLSTTNSFFWNKFWTFSAKDKASVGQAASFYLIAAGGALLNTGAASFVVNYIAHPAVSDNLWANIGALIGNLYLAYFAHGWRQRDMGNDPIPYRVWLLETAEGIWNGFELE